MKKNHQFDLSGVVYLQVRDIRFEYNLPEVAPLDLDFLEEVFFNVELSSMLELEDELIRILLTVNLKGELEDKEEVSFNYTTDHLYRVKNLRKLVVEKEDNLDVNVELEKALNDLAYDSVRGMLQQKTQSTVFNKFMLPVAGLNKLEKVV